MIFNERFSIALIITADNEAQVQEIISKIPHIESFYKCIIDFDLDQEKLSLPKKEEQKRKS